MSQPNIDQREWISFDDPREERTWMFDATFLESAWTCIYGAGCQGIEEEPDPGGHRGCCSHGAYFSDDPDRLRVESAAASLSAEHWQMASTSARLGGPIYCDEDGSWRTRVVDDVCIFHNSPDHPGGPGCALHQAALASEVSPITIKPEVCWQVPVRREDHVAETGHLFTMIREWARRDWGDGGHDFGWWCTDAPESFVGHEPVYITLASELVELCGHDIYSSLVEVLDERASYGAQSVHPVHLPLPVRKSSESA